MSDYPAVSDQTAHQILLATQRQILALVAERNALREQVAALAAERDALRAGQLTITGARAVLDTVSAYLDHAFVGEGPAETRYLKAAIKAQHAILTYLSLDMELEP